MMRWGIPKAEPKIGDTRQLTGFAVVPVPLNDGTWLWWEKYTLEQRYVSDIGNGDMMESGDPGWIVVGRTALRLPVAAGTPSEAEITDEMVRAGAAAWRVRVERQSLAEWTQEREQQYIHPVVRDVLAAALRVPPATSEATEHEADFALLERGAVTLGLTEHGNIGAWRDGKVGIGDSIAEAIEALASAAPPAGPTHEEETR